jgi:hypothetical protein
MTQTLYAHMNIIKKEKKVIYIVKDLSIMEIFNSGNKSPP